MAERRAGTGGIAPTTLPPQQYGAPPNPMEVPGTAAWFGAQVLSAARLPVTPDNVQFIVNWIKREGGGGANNPLNTTLAMPNSTPLQGNPDGVQNYKTIQEGVQATAETLLNGYYNDVVNAMKSGHIDLNSTYAGLHTWSGGGYDGLSGVQGDPNYVVGKQATSGEAAMRGAPASNLNPEVSQGAFEQALSKNGMASALLESVPELNKLFQKAIQTQMWSSPTGVQAFENEIMNTEWWKTHSAAARQFADLKASDPAELTRKIQQSAADIYSQAQTMGIPVNEAVAHYYAVMAVQNGMDAQELTQALAHRLKYTGQTMSGSAGADIQSLQQLAGQYYVPVSNNTYNHLLQQMLVGNMSQQNVQDYFKNLAVSAFPSLEKQLNSGQTVAQIADPYVQQMAKTFEVDPQSIAPRDPTIMKALAAKDSSGQQSQMPLWQFETMLRQDPRWLKTDNARSSLMGAATGLLQNMGLIAGGMSVGNNAGAVSLSG